MEHPTTGSWEENTITAAVLRALGSQDDRTWSDLDQRVCWRTCKLVGDNEEKRGDIAIRVRVYLTSEIYVEGVAFYEAKRAFYDNWKTGQFSSIDKEQLDRLHGSSFGDGHLLLYDVFQSAEDPSEVSGASIVIPLSYVMAYKEANLVPHRKLHKQGQHFMTILMRHLRGFHLDTRDQALEDFEHGLGRFNYVMTVATAISRDITMDLDCLLDLPECYVPLAVDLNPQKREVKLAEPETEKQGNEGPDTPGGSTWRPK